MGFLFTVETLNLVFSHRLLLVRDFWHVLDKADHGFVALGVKLVVVSGF
jgi:hypothetical protein